MTRTHARMWTTTAALVVVWAAAAQYAMRPIVSAATVDPSTPPARLADTGLYADGSLSVAPSNRAFLPQYPLWSDGLLKRRWIYLPPGATIDASNDASWTFPVGTKLWKEFSLPHRRVETRFIWKTEAGWMFASYVWNEAGTDAVLAPDDGVPNVAEVAPGRRHSIPSRTDCTACHGTSHAGPLGFNALQLSPDRDPNAVHGAVLEPEMLTLRELVADARLHGARADLVSNPPRIRTNDPATRAMLGYLLGNCAHCHNGRGDIAALAPVVRYEDLLKDGDAVAGSLIGAATQWQIPGSAGDSVAIKPGSPESSALLARLRSRSPSSQMPPLGTVVRDQEAVDLVTRWIVTDAAALRVRPRR